MVVHPTRLGGRCTSSPLASRTNAHVKVADPTASSPWAASTRILSNNELHLDPLSTLTRVTDSGLSLEHTANCLRGGMSVHADACWRCHLCAVCGEVFVGWVGGWGWGCPRVGVVRCCSARTHSRSRTSNRKWQGNVCMLGCRK
jgi:hypothetical protein